jgi:hypothetical protein
MSSDTYISSFVAKYESDTSVTLSWSGSFNTVTVQISTDNNNFTDVLQNSSSTSYTITGLTANNVYYASITPYDSSSTAGTTHTLYFTTNYTASITSASTGTSSATSIPVYWSGTYYTVKLAYKRTIDADSKYTYTTITGGSSYTVTGLQADSSYVFQIIPYDINDISGSAYTVTSSTDYSSYITTAYLGDVAARTVNFNWTGYYSYANLQYSTNNTNWSTAAVLNTPARSLSGSYDYVLLDPITTYYFRVAPYSANYNYGTNNATTISCETLAGFTYTAVDTILNREIDISLNGRYSTFEVYLSYDQGSTYSLYSTEDASNTSNYIYSNTVTIEGLSPYTQYYFYFVPYNDTVQGTSSELFDVTTDFYAEANAVISDYQTDNITLEFNTDGISYPYYDHCLIQISEDNSTFYDSSMIYSVPDSENTVLYVADSLNSAALYANFTYYFKIQPYSQLDVKSPYVYYLSQATLGNVEADAVTLSISSEVITLSWTGYYYQTYVEYSSDNFASSSTGVVVDRDSSISTTTKDATTTTYSFSALSSASTYYFRITPINYNSNYGETSAIHYNAIITDFYMDISTNTLTLYWDGTYDTVTLQSSSDNSTFTDYAADLSANNYYTISGASSSTTYYRLVPYNDLGEAGRTTDSIFNPYITTITTTNIDASSITLSWSGAYDYVTVQYSADNSTFTTLYENYTSSSATISPAVAGADYDVSDNYFYYNVIPYAYPISSYAYDESSYIQGLTSSTTYNPIVTGKYITNVSYYTMTLYWSGKYKKIRIYYDDDDSFSSGTYLDNMVPNDGTVTTSSVFTSLSSNTTYYFKLVPYNTNGDAGYVSTSYLSSKTSSLFDGLNFYWSSADASFTFFTFKWTNNGYSNFKLYSSDGTLKVSSSTKTSYKETGLSPNSLYGYYILLYDYNNNYETSNSYYYGYTTPNDTGLSFKQVTTTDDLPSGYSLSARRVLFTWSSTSYYNNITISNSTTGSTPVSFSVSGDLFVYDSSANGEGLLTQNTKYTYLIKLSGYNDSAVTYYTKTATTFGSISSYSIINTTSYPITAASLPISFTGIFNGVILNVSDGTNTGNVYLYGLSTGSSAVSYVYTLTSSNSIVKEANKYYGVQIYTINDSSAVLLSTSAATYGYTLGKMTKFSTSSIIDSSSVYLTWDGSFNYTALESSTGNTFASISTAAQYQINSSKIYYVSGLLPNKKYYFRVTPLNTPLSSGSDVSGTSVTWDVSATTMGKMTSFTVGYVSDISATAISLSWDGSFSSVSIEVSADGGTTYTTTSGSPYTGKYAIISGLTQANYLYYFRVTPINSVGLYSTTTTGGVYAYTRGKVTDLSWTLTADTSSIYLYVDGSYNGFTVDESTSATFSAYVSKTYTPETDKVYLFDGLTYYTKYYFRVRPYNAPTTTSGNVYGNNSSTVNAYTWGKITSAYSSNATIYTIPVTWDGSFNYALVKISADGGSTYTDASAVYVYQGAKTTTFSGLAGFSTYYFKVYPYNDVSAVGDYYQTTGTTLAYIGNIYASGITSAGFTVNISDAGYSSFYVYNNTTGGSYSAVSAPTSAISMADLSPNTYYTVTAYAYNYTITDGCGNTTTATLSDTKTLGSIVGATTDVSTAYYAVSLNGYYTSFKIISYIDGAWVDSSYVDYGSTIYVYGVEANTKYYYIAYANNLSGGTGTDVSSGFYVTTAGEIASSFYADANYSKTNAIKFGVEQGGFSAIRIKTATDSAFTNLLYSVDISYDDIPTLGNVYTQGGLSENTKYYFIAAAINATGDEGSTSTTLYLSTLGNLYSASLDTANSTTASAIPIKWTGTYYSALVEYATAASGVYSTYKYLYNNSSATSTAITGNTYVPSLLPNTQYYFRVTPISLDIVSGTALTITDASAVTLPQITSVTQTALYDTSAAFFIDGSFSTVMVYSSPASIVKTYTYTTGGVYTNSDISGLVYDTSYVFYFLPYNSISVTNTVNSNTLRTWPKITRFYLTGVFGVNSIGVAWDGSYDSVQLEYSTNSTTWTIVNTAATGYGTTVSNLASNTRYYFRAIPAKFGVSGKYVYISDTSSVTYGYIKTLNAAVVDMSGITVTWDGSFDTIQLYTSTTSGTYGSTYSTYSGYSTIVGGLDSNVKYYFKAVAINTTGASATYLQDASATTYGYIKTAAATALDSSAATVVWDGSFAAVNVYWSTAAGTYTTYTTFAGGAYSGIISGLDSNKKYYYKVVAYNVNGEGTVTVQDISALTYPYVKSLAAAAVDMSAIALTWDGSFAAVNIYLSTTAGTYTSYTTYSGYSATIASLASNTTYFYKAVATNDTGSGTITVQDSSALTYGYIKTAASTALDSSAATVVWDGSFASVNVYWSTTAGSYSTYKTFAGGAYSGIISGLDSNKKYYYKVAAYNVNGEGTVTVQDISALTYPYVKSLAAAAVDMSAIALTWDGSFAAVNIYLSTTAGTYTSYTTYSGYSATVADLASNTTYFYKAVATNDTGSGTITAQDISALTYGYIKTATATALDISAATIAWDGSFAAVNVYYSTTAGTYTTYTTFAGGAYSGIVSGLAYNTRYYYKVAAYNANGEGTVTVQDISALTYPYVKSLEVSAYDSSAVSIVWDGSFATMNIYWSTTASTYTTYNTYTSYDTILGGLSSNVKYYFKAEAVNETGTMVIQDVSITTYGFVKTFTATPYDSSSTTLVWDGSFDSVKVYWSTTSGSYSSTYMNTYSGIYTAFITGLDSNQTYYYKIDALDVTGETVVATKTTNALTYPYMKSLTAAAYDSSGATITWDGSFATVNVYWSKTADTYTTYETYSGYSATIDTLDPNETYYFKAVGVNTTGSGTITQEGASALTYPYMKSLTAAAYDSSGATITWDGSFATVKVYWSKTADTYTTYETYSGYSATIDTLDPNETYYFKAVGVNDTGSGTIWVEGASALTYGYMKTATVSPIDTSAVELTWDGSFSSVNVYWSTTADSYDTENVISITGGAYSSVVNNFAANTTYYYKITAVNTTGEGTIVIQDFSALTYPSITALSITSYDSSSVTFAWDGSYSSVNIYYNSFADTYYDATVTTNYGTTAAANFTGSTGTLAGLQATNLYYFKATGLNTTGEGTTIYVQDVSTVLLADFSAIVTAGLTYGGSTNTVTPFISSLTATSYDSSAITVAWDGSFTNVNIYYSTTEGTYDSSTYQSFVGTYSGLVTGLDYNTIYYYKAVALYSGTVGTTTIQDVSAITYGYVTSMTATATDNSSITVSWTGSFDSINLYYSTTAGSYTDMVTSSANTYTFTGLAYNKTYYYKAAAVNAAGTTPNTIQDISALTYPYIKSHTATAYDSSAVTVTWDGSFSSVNVYWNTSAASYGSNVVSFTSTYSGVVGGLEANTTYYFKVVAVNTTGSGSTSVEGASALTYGNITSLSATAYDSSGITVSWTGAFSTVNLYYSTTAGSYTGSATSYSGTSTVVQNLSSNATYYFKVEAINSTGTGAIKAQDVGALTYPYIKTLTAAAYDSSAITVTWDGSYSSVNVYYSTTAGTYSTYNTYSTDKTAVFAGLTSNLRYYFKAVGVNTTGSGTITIQDASAVTQGSITSLTATAYDNSAITVAWGGSYSSVKLYYSTTAGTYSTYNTYSSGSSVLLTGLSSNATYYYKAVAVNSAGADGTAIYKQDISALTYPMVTSLRISYYDASSVTLTWDGSFSSVNVFYNSFTGSSYASKVTTNYTTPVAAFTGYSGTVKGLTANTMYYFKVQGNNITGTGTIFRQDVSTVLLGDFSAIVLATVAYN